MAWRHEMSESERKAEGSFVVARKISLEAVPEERQAEAIGRLKGIEPVFRARMEGNLHVAYDEALLDLQPPAMRERGCRQGPLGSCLPAVLSLV